MEAFRYKAVNDQGRILHGTIDAVNAGDLEVRLSRMGLDLITYKEFKSKGRTGNKRGVKRVDLITFCFHLEQLIRAGVPILEGLADLRDSTDNPRLREVTSGLIESIEGGKNLSESMGDYPAVFSKVFVNLVRAGEQSGQLPRVLQQIVESLKWQDEQAAYTKKLFLYPVFVGTVVLGVLAFLMAYLVPELLKFVQGMGQALPLHTRILIVVSNSFVTYWYVFVTVPVVAAIVIYAMYQTNPGFRLKFDAFALRIPLLGPISKKIILTRFVSYFSIMYSSGITVLECIRIGADIVGNRAIEEAVRSAGRQIADGSGISASFESTGLFPPLVLRMLRVGENTGALEDALANVSYFYTREVREAVDRLQTIIGPAMTVVLGAMLGWVMLSVLGPIYDLITKIKF